MFAVVIHLDVAALAEARSAAMYEGTASLAGRLTQCGLAAVVLLIEARSAASIQASFMLRLRRLEQVTLLLSQPGSLPVHLRLALLRAAPATAANTVLISMSTSSTAAEQANLLGYGATVHVAATAVAQLHAWAMQAVAIHAARNHQPPPLLVGYVMKESRQLALSKQGMLPLLPPTSANTASSTPPSLSAATGPSHSAPAARPLCFMPVDLGSDLAHQLQHCHIVLQKLTDFLQPGNGSGEVAAFTPQAAALLAYLSQQQQQQQQQHSECQRQERLHAAAPGAPVAAAGGGAAVPAQLQLPICLVDAAAALQPVMDRAELVPHLQEVALALRQQAVPMRAPASLLLTAVSAAATPRQLAAAGVALPCILKPRAACGVAEAHQMAFVLHGSGFDHVEVPLPALAQEYVDHGGVMYKVYVAGASVSWTQRKSTPDLSPLVARLAADPEADIPASISFDSLQSLPTSLPWEQRQHQQQQQQEQQQSDQQFGAHQRQRNVQVLKPTAPDNVVDGAPGQEFMRQPTFEAVAAALRRRLGLTLFGFDIVFDRAAGELVIVDVNYFPSYQGIAEAPAALQTALRELYAVHAASHAAKPCQDRM